jgi:hypothetical protein
MTPILLNDEILFYYQIKEGWNPQIGEFLIFNNYIYQVMFRSIKNDRLEIHVRNFIFVE